MEIKGVDLSYCQKGIDYNKLKAEGVEFAIVRAGFAETEDNLLKAHLDGLKKVGIPFGLYWYSYAYSMAETQKEADACIAVIKNISYRMRSPIPYFMILRRKSTLKSAKWRLPIWQTNLR